MDFAQLKKGLDYTKKKKKIVLFLGLLGLTWYGAHRINTCPSVIKKKQRLMKLFGAFLSVAEMVSDSAEAIGIVSKDLKEFIQSDSDQIPQSLKQISKIATSNEFSESLTKVTRALTVGILRGYKHESTKNGGSFGGSSGFCDRVMDKLFSDSGSGFASVVVGSLARNLVIALYSDVPREKGSDQKTPSWIEASCQDNYREVIGNWIQIFISTAVTVYLDKTMDINTYDEIFAGLTNPKHEAKVTEMLVTIFNGVVDTYIRTSQRIGATNSDALLSSSYSKIDFNEQSSIGTKLISATLKGKRLVSVNQDKGWISKVSSTLAVPSNRKLIIDMTGMLTFGTIRSFLEFLFEKLSECVRRSVDVVHREVVGGGVEVLRYVSSRPSTIATICLSLCLHILNGPWILAPTGFHR